MGCAVVRVLITGATGYLGSVLVPLLSAAGYETVSPTGDVRYPDLLSLRGADAVVCLAAAPNRPASAQGPLAPGALADPAWQVNRDAAVGLAKAARRAGVPLFLFASSCSVFGAAGATDGLLDEDAPRAPITAYAAAKAAAEDELCALAGPGFA